MALEPLQLREETLPVSVVMVRQGPQPGDLLTVSDDEEPAEKARVVRREGNRVWVQILLPTYA